MRALGFLVIVGWSKAKYLLVQIDDVVDEYVQDYDPVYPIDSPIEYPAGISYLFENLRPIIIPSDFLSNVLVSVR